MKKNDNKRKTHHFTNTFEPFQRRRRTAIGGTKDESIKEKARHELSSLTINQITHIVLIDDEVSSALRSEINPNLLNEIGALTLSQLKALLLSQQCSEWVHKYRMGLSSEVIAAVVKLMTNEQLSYVSKTLFNPIEDNSQNQDAIFIGSRTHFGSRIQPNSPGDDLKEILFHTFEGIVHGCGDVIIVSIPRATLSNR